MQQLELEVKKAFGVETERKEETLRDMIPWLNTNNTERHNAFKPKNPDTILKIDIL